MKTSLISSAIALAVALAALALTSCAGVMSGLTGQPVPTVSVSRDDGVEFEVALVDVITAEGQPGKVWGLYDAGQIADLTSQGKALGKSSSK